MTPTRTSGEFHQNECSICLDGFDEKPAKKLSCDHLFHEGCVDEWIEKNPTCPLCRAEIPARGELPQQLPAAPQPEVEVNNPEVGSEESRKRGLSRAVSFLGGSLIGAGAVLLTASAIGVLASTPVGWGLLGAGAVIAGTSLLVAWKSGGMEEVKKHLVSTGIGIVSGGAAASCQLAAAPLFLYPLGAKFFSCSVGAFIGIIATVIYRVNTSD